MAALYLRSLLLCLCLGFLHGLDKKLRDTGNSTGQDLCPDPEELTATPCEHMCDDSRPCPPEALCCYGSCKKRQLGGRENENRFRVCLYPDRCKEGVCKNGAFCVNLAYGNYMCTCLDGFYGTNCENEIDECDSSPCYQEASCVDLINDYMCCCPAEYVGKNCEIKSKCNNVATNTCRKCGKYPDAKCVMMPRYIAINTRGQEVDVTTECRP